MGVYQGYWPVVTGGSLEQQCFNRNAFFLRQTQDEPIQRDTKMEGEEGGLETVKSFGRVEHW